MTDQNPPRDDDPSGMTDFEKNATLGELEQIEQLEPQPAGLADELDERQRQDRGNRGPEKQPGFGQGA
jgi:hypothetical protein